MADSAESVTSGTPSNGGSSQNVSSTNILGDNPKIVRAGAKQETQTQPTAKLGGKPAQVADQDLRAQTRDTTGADVSDFDSMIDEAEKALSGPAPDSDTDDIGADEPDQEEIKDASPRLQKRLRSTIQRLHAAESQVQQFKQWGQQLTNEHRQVLQHSQGLARQLQESQMQLASLGSQVKTMMELQGKGPAQPQSDVDKFQQATIESALAKARETFDPRVEEQAKKIQALTDTLQKQQRDAENRATRARINAAVERATDATFFPEGYPDDTKGRLRSVFGNLVAAYSYGRRIPPERAAQELAPMLRDHGFALLRAHSKSRGSRMAQSQNTNPPGTPGMAPRKGSATITNEEAKRAGFKDSLDAAISKGGLIRARH
jgi:hypothetical protein